MEKECAPEEPSSSSSSQMRATTKHTNFEAELIGPSKGFNSSNSSIAHWPIDQASQRAALAMQASDMSVLDVHSKKSALQLYAPCSAVSTNLRQQFLPGKYVSA